MLGCDPGNLSQSVPPHNFMPKNPSIKTTKPKSPVGRQKMWEIWEIWKSVEEKLAKYSIHEFMTLRLPDIAGDRDGWAMPFLGETTSLWTGRWGMRKWYVWVAADAGQQLSL